VYENIDFVSEECKGFGNCKITRCSQQEQVELQSDNGDSTKPCCRVENPAYIFKNGNLVISMSPKQYFLFCFEVLQPRWSLMKSYRPLKVEMEQFT